MTSETENVIRKAWICCNHFAFLYVLVDVDEMGVVLGVDVGTDEFGAEG
jgi:hypothetical protein